MALDRTTVAKIARLARIKVKPEELDGLAGELNGMLTWVEQLQQVNVDGVEPMTGTVVEGAGARPQQAAAQMPRGMDGVRRRLDREGFRHGHRRAGASGRMGRPSARSR